MDTVYPDALAPICADTLAEVARRRVGLGIEALLSRIHAYADATRGFGAALMTTVASGGTGLIAEIKKASPSAGVIRPEFDPIELAETYADAGATCLSVLTNGAHFQGSPEHLKAARAVTKLPVLRKDFMLDPWQIYESRAMGADCVLLIMAALSDQQARELEEIARALDMDVLAEVHDHNELNRALGLQTPLIGINNRDLKTMQISIETTLELASYVPADRFLISESGIRTNDDVKRLAAVGANALLVGESLLRHQDVGAATRKLLGTDA